MRTLVVGLGNPILSDDGVGVRVADLVREWLPPDADVDVAELSIGGLRLMEAMVGYDRAVVVDALTTGGVAPGEVVRLTEDDLRALRATEHSASPHDATLVVALDLGRRAGVVIPADIVVIGVGVANVLDFSDRPTPEVAAAVPRAARAVMSELGFEPPERGHGSDRRHDAPC